MADGPDKRDEHRAAPESVAEAMNRVLGAERDALAELDACRVEADRTLEAARREARAIMDHAEQLARRIHGRTERLASARAQQLVEAAAAREARQASQELLADAVARLAARMTGEGHA